MEKRMRPFFERYTATAGRPKTFQVITMLLVLIALVAGVSCLWQRIYGS